MTFEQPLVFLWIGAFIVALHIWGWRTRAAPHVIGLNVEHRLKDLRWTWRRATIWMPLLLGWLGIAILAMAAARPYDELEIDLVDVHGVAIQLVIDRSGSMLHDDYQLDGRRVSRLSAVVDAASRFVVGDESLGWRTQDMIGLVVFARFAEQACPLTLDHEQVVARLEQLTVARDFREDGTAIGDGLSLAIAELESLRASLTSDSVQPDLSRVVILLTDGQDNASEIDIPTAIDLAVHYGVRVYVLGLESEFATASAAQQRLQAERDQLAAMAAATGGQFYVVGDSESLRQVYTAISELERRTLGQQPLRVKRHWAVSWFEVGRWTIPPLALVGLLCLSLAALLRRSIYLQPVGSQ